MELETGQTNSKLLSQKKEDTDPNINNKTLFVVKQFNDIGFLSSRDGCIVSLKLLFYSWNSFVFVPITTTIWKCKLSGSLKKFCRQVKSPSTKAKKSPFCVCEFTSTPFQSWQGRSDLKRGKLTANVRLVPLKSEDFIKPISRIMKI